MPPLFPFTAETSNLGLPLAEGPSLGTGLVAVALGLGSVGAVQSLPTFCELLLGEFEEVWLSDLGLSLFVHSSWPLSLSLGEHGEVEECLLSSFAVLASRGEVEDGTNRGLVGLPAFEPKHALFISKFLREKDEVDDDGEEAKGTTSEP